MNEHKDVPSDRKAIAKKRRDKLEKRRARIAPILRSVYEATDEFCFSPPWDFLRPDSHCRSGIADESDLVETLAADFAPEALIEAGVAVMNEEGVVVQNPRLAEGPLVFLRNANDRVFDIVMADGTCITGLCPLFKIVHDRFTQATSAGREVIVVSSMDDVARLRALGVAAAPLTSLANTSAPGLRRLMRIVGADSHAAISAVPDRLRSDLPEDVRVTDDGATPAIVLVLTAGAFDAPTTEQASQLSAVVKMFMDAGRHLLIPWQGVEVWWPTAAEREELAYRRRKRSPSLVAEFFACQRSTSRLTDLTTAEGPPPAPSPAEALENASRELASLGPRFDDAPGECEDRRRDAAAERRRLIEERFVHRLVALAMENGDPVGGQLQLQLAESFRLTQLILPLVRQQLEQCLQSGVDDDSVIVTPAAMQLYGKFTNDLYRLSKELRKKD